MKHPKLLTALTLISLMFVYSCEKPPIVPLDDIIKLEVLSANKPVGDNSLIADGKTQVKVVVYLPKDANESFKTIKFKTSAGTFNVSETDKTEKTVYAVSTASGDKLEATADLTLGTSSGAYTITAQIVAKPDYKAEQTFQTLPMDVADMITFEIEDYDKLVTEHKLKANGLTRIKLIASVPLGVSEAQRLIEFKSSAGTFEVIGEEKNSKQVTATLQSSGDTKLRAITYLTLGTEAGDYTLSATLANAANFSTEKTIRVLPVANADVIQLAFEPASGIRADGSSLVRVQVTLANTTITKVTLTTNDGSFLNSSEPKSTELEVNSEGKAEANLRVGTEVNDYLLTAKLTGSAIAVTKTLQPLRANPSQILIEPSTLYIEQAGAGVKLDMFLKRETGKVSTGTSVSVRSYQVQDATEIITGRFTGKNNVSDTNGKVSMEFFLDEGPLVANKPIIIEITAQKDDSTKVTEKIELKVKTE